MAHAKLQAIRQRYAFQCGYCGVSEVDAGGELTTDHFKPVGAGGDDSDENLVYACARCNSFKGDFWPEPSDLLSGHRVLHPLHDNPIEHLQEDLATGELRPITETGRYHITLLHLNRPALVSRRLKQRMVALLAAKQQHLDADNRQLRATLQAQEHYILHLRKLMERG